VISLKPIGVLKADFQQKFGTPRQGSLAPNSRAVLELAPEWKGRGILSGLEGFSHVWVITHLHLSHNTRTRGKVHPPRLKGAKIGIMASRSPHRPNPIGLTLATIVSVDGDKLVLSGIDTVNGTPVLDLKPYLAEADRPAEFKSGWATNLPSTTRECSFSNEALADIDRLVDEPARFRALVEEMLVLDPRPPAYLGRMDALFAIWVSRMNVIFRFHEERFTVVKVEEVPGDGPTPGVGVGPKSWVMD
jgi:tRNA-Thr(GGU) m(6)t(6)A37 methyltransferase TsaA